MEIAVADAEACQRLVSYLRERGYPVVERQLTRFRCSRCTALASGTTDRYSSAACANGERTTAA
jgi:hypothetical protein